MDIVCWLDQEFCHMDSDDPCVWTLVIEYIKCEPECECVVLLKELIR